MRVCRCKWNENYNRFSFSGHGFIIQQAYYEERENEDVSQSRGFPDLQGNGYLSVVKKMSAILFLSVCLLSTNGINELLKVNTLVQHYYETKKEDNTVTFFNFLFMHYIADDFNDKDNSRDDQLPFKSAGTCISNSTALYMPGKNIQLLTSHPFPLNTEDFITKRDSFILPSFHAFVWHPPKLS